ncbi:MAG TPA: hypothetical protein VL137_09145 [Polyangiaceae bacterium]|jgi:hypothetical protein|nr:hypothetical protein [Polyangiaceae bacterium]
MTICTIRLPTLLVAAAALVCGACEYHPPSGFFYCVEDQDPTSVPAAGTVRLDQEGTIVTNFDRIGVQYSGDDSSVSIAVGACAAKGNDLWRLRLEWTFPATAVLPVPVERHAADTDFSAYVIRCDDQQCLTGKQHLLQNVGNSTVFTAQVTSYDADVHHFAGAANITNSHGQVSDIKANVDW